MLGVVFPADAHGEAGRIDLYAGRHAHSRQAVGTIDVAARRRGLVLLLAQGREGRGPEKAGAIRALGGSAVAKSLDQTAARWPVTRTPAFLQEQSLAIFFQIQ